MKKTVTLLALSAALFSTATFAHDHESHNTHAPKAHAQIMKKNQAMKKPFNAFEGLNLTEQQKAQIKQIQQSHRPQFSAEHRKNLQAAQDKFEQHRLAEDKIITSKTFDEHAARQLIEARQQERLTMEKKRAEFELNNLKKRHAIFQVLTPAQQKQFLANQEQARQKQHEKMSRMKHPKTPKKVVKKAD